MKKIFSTSETGRSMIEMLGVLAIIGVLSVGGLAGYSKAMTKYKINKTQEQLQLLISGIRTLYATQSSFQGLTISQLISVGTMPEEMVRGTTTDTAYDPFGSAIYLDVADDFTNFTIGIEKLSDKACIEIANSNWQSSGTSLQKILIGTAATTGDTFTWSSASTGNLSNMQLSEIISACDNDDDNGIYFTFQ